MKRLIRKILVHLLLILGGIVSSSLIILSLLPYLISYGREEFSNTVFGTVEFTLGMGDIFVAQSGSIEPPPNPYEVLSSHSLAYDAEGFRIPERTATYYDVIALGDSFTEAANVARPWTDVLAGETNLSVRNLGFRGYGPQEETLVMQEYGARENAKVVIIGFFGGNDISNAESFDERSDEFSLPELAQNAITEFSANTEPWNVVSETYQYPVYLDLAGETFPIAFLNSYVSWLSPSMEDLRSSASLEAIRASWQSIRDAAGEDACVIVAYFPSKEQIYLPYVLPEYRHQIIDGQETRILNLETLEFERDSSQEPSYEDLLNNRQNTADVLVDNADEMGLEFLDLSPAFQNAADNGALLYYSYDTHWNQTGHDLAGKEIARFIETNCNF